MEPYKHRSEIPAEESEAVKLRRAEKIAEAVRARMEGMVALRRYDPASVESLTALQPTVDDDPPILQPTPGLQPVLIRTILKSGQNTTPAPAAGSSLFGNTQANQTSTTGGGLFGNAASSTPKPSGGLFGTAPANNTQPQQQQPSGGLFGSTNGNAAQPAQQQQTGGGGLFGGLGATQQQQQPASNTLGGGGGGGLFGALGGNTQQQQPQQQQQQQPQQQASGGLFGGSAFAKPASSFMNQSSQAKPGFGYVIPSFSIWF